MGKVPALRHGETVVTEAAAICCYLADAFPQAGLAPPPGDRLRGPYYRWLFFAAGPLEAAAINGTLGVAVPEDRKPMVGYGELPVMLSAIEDALAGRDYLVGDRFSAADVYVGSSVGWGMRFGSLEKRPALERYFERLIARPAAIRAASSSSDAGTVPATGRGRQLMLPSRPATRTRGARCGCAR